MGMRFELVMVGLCVERQGDGTAKESKEERDFGTSRDSKERYGLRRKSEGV
jgi:hypothetical protein